MNGYTTDIAYQYGRLIRKVFDFQPLPPTSESIDISTPEFLNSFEFDYAEDYFNGINLKEDKKGVLGKAKEVVDEYMQVPLAEYWTDVMKEQ